MRKGLVYVSKAFDHATFSTLKKNTNNHEHSLVHQRQQTDVKYVHNITKITISLSARTSFFIIYFTAKCTISPAH